MKRFLFIIIAGAVFCQTSFAFESFVVETDKQSADESLNRISGHIDPGFSPVDNTYQSEHHQSSGPFAKTDY